MKKIISMLLAMTMVLSLAACGTKQTAETEAQTETQAPETTEASTTAAPATAAAETEAAETKAPETTAVPETTAAAVQTAQEPVKILHPLVSDYYECCQNADNTFIYQLNSQFLSLNEEEAAQYPNLSTALGEDLGEYIYGKTAEFLEQWKAATAERAIDLAGETPFVEQTSIYRMDDQAASILVNMYEFLGGAHGSTLLQCFNYNTQKLGWIQLSELVSDNEKLQQVLVTELKKQYPDCQFFDLENDIKKYVLDTPAAEGKISYIWTMDYDSLMIWFPEEALASHADGSQMIDLKFADYPDLIHCNYGAAPADYIAVMSPYTPCSFGSRSAQVDYRVDENGIYNKLVFSLDGTETAFDIFSYRQKTCYVTRNGHEYFYVFTEGDDEEREFTVYKVDGNTVTEAAKMEGYITEEYAKAEDTTGRGVGYENAYASTKTSQYPADPAGLAVTILPNGKGGESKKMTAVVAEDGSFSLK